MPHMDTVRPLKPPMTDEVRQGVIDAALIAEWRKQAERVEAARRNGIEFGYRLAKSRIPFSVTWLSGFFVGAVTTLVVESLR